MDRAKLAERMATRFGWRIVGDPPPDPVVVMVGAPHTSNWDFPLMLWMMWARGLEPRFLMKKEAFRGPGGAVLRRLGGIPVDRAAAAGLVDDLVAQAESAEHHFTIVIAPEGTRSHGRYWKSGFYRIARQANVPICLSFIGGPDRTIGFGPSFLPSGDMVADMDLVREFYADKPGIRPGRRTEPRLREEDQESAGLPDESPSGAAAPEGGVPRATEPEEGAGPDEGPGAE